MGIMRMFWWALYAWHRLLCLVHGHEMVMQYDRDRLSLRCLSCGYRTPGWALDEAPVPRTSTPVRVSTAWRVKDRRAA
jgi:hypothetical protein